MSLVNDDLPREGRKLWAQAVCDALRAGTNANEAVNEADIVMLSFHARFSPTNKGMLNATTRLDTLLKFRPRCDLIGEKVTVITAVDIPPIGVIKDFQEPYAGSTVGTALVAWEAGIEEWELVDSLYIVRKSL